MNAQKRYFLVPSFDDFPVNGPLFLGSVITNPKLPQKSLNADYRELPVGEKILKGTPLTDWSLTVERDSKGEVSLWAKLLQIISLGLVSGKETLEKDDFQFDLMTTEFFEPTEEYLKKTITQPKIVRHLEDAPSTTSVPLYMIIGLKTVKGATIAQTIREKKRRDQYFGPGNSEGMSTIGGTDQRSSSYDETRKFRTSEPHVIGFRIRKIIVYKDKSIGQSDVTEGTYFGADGVKTRVEKGWIVEGLDEHDCGKDVASNLDVSQVFDDQGGYCQCIYQH